ncbi:hypothetical protein AJ88_01120 [Mesorhizobium amorphae CCBAU 01583]|nr:hypothetical protein AJ88_01120 [Mesorhizobium amorphae CCBAU 01583]
MDAVWSDVRAMVGEIGQHIDGFHAAEIIRDGFEVVILGAPNAGKSSLFNALARREAAIVTDEPGTTRDLLEVVLDLKGMRVRITDTAGLREAPGKVEAIGIEKARAKARGADLLLLLEDMVDPVDAGAVPSDAPMLRIGTKPIWLGASVWRAGRRTTMRPSRPGTAPGWRICWTRSAAARLRRSATPAISCRRD